MDNFANIVLAVHMLVALALIAVVMLQRSEGGALGIGGGGGLMSARGAGNALTRATAILAAIFFATSVGLTIMARQGGPSALDLEDVGPAPAQEETGDTNLPALPSLPGFEEPAAPAPAMDAGPTESPAASDGAAEATAEPSDAPAPEAATPSDVPAEEAGDPAPSP